ncbi:MAG: GGDEF domain-containing protein [Bradyrhizobiaceae bacterium]|nr:MAG: GGDEF domain-containing protein [Bradyrhizobiaceae bacterium]
MMALSYVIDAILLLIFAYAGTIPVTTGPLYLLISLLTIGFFTTLSDASVTDRFTDNYLVTQQTVVSISIMLAFIYLAPEVGCVFLCSLFVVFAFGSLRSTPWQNAVSLAIVTIGLAILFLLTDKPIAMPLGSHTERFATMLTFVAAIGRCMFVGMFASALRESFYNQGVRLQEAYKRIEELAELDELTGSHNRRSIMKALDEEMERAARTRMSCSIALIDLDWFKKINDRFGHPTGDEVLRTFAITIFANIRSIDKFGRYGGEEFLLILPETSDIAAEQTLNRLRMIVADLDWSTISPGMAVTLSAGVVTMRQNETADSLLARADVALYQAKDCGRNRIERG